MKFQKDEVESIKWVNPKNIDILKLHDREKQFLKAFIKWKATVIYLILCLTLLISRYVLNKNLMQKMLTSILKGASDTEQEIDIPKAVWDKINLMWSAITLIIAGLNIYIAYNFPLDFWVNFKVFGLMGITFVSIFATIIALYKYLPNEEEPVK